MRRCLNFKVLHIFNKGNKNKLAISLNKTLFGLNFFMHILLKIVFRKKFNLPQYIAIRKKLFRDQYLAIK